MFRYTEHMRALARARVHARTHART
jgi:hypothetical protein